MRDIISRIAKIRQDLEGRIDSVIIGISSQRFSGFEDWIAAILQQREHSITMCSALGLPLGKTNDLLSLLTSDSPASITMVRVVGRRTYYFLRVLQEVLSNPLAPNRWPVFAPVLRSNMELCRPLLPKRESRWSVIKDNLIMYGFKKADLSRYSETTYDPTQWAILQCISVGPDLPMVGKDYLLVAQTLGHYLNEHNFLDPANKWWTFERYFWAAQRMASAGLSQTPDNYELIRNKFKDFIESSDSLSEPNPEIAKTMITPEIYRRERTLMFAAIGGMKILNNPIIAIHGFPESVKQQLTYVISKAEDEILQMVDHDHLWWMCQKLILLYNLIHFRALTETRAFLKRNKLKLKEYEVNNKYVYSRLLKQKIDAVSKNIKLKLKNPRVNNWQISVLILGPSGVGKSVIVESVCANLRDYILIGSTAIQEKMLQELATRDDFDNFLKETKEQFKRFHKQKRIPVFIDEFHSKMSYNQFTAILPFLTRENYALPIFATTECNSREEFQQRAASGQITHKIDFATRIQNWLELPGLEYSATQRMLIYLKHSIGHRKTWECKKQNLAQVGLDFKKWKTARDIQQLEAHELDEVVEKIRGSDDFSNQELKDRLSLFDGKILVS